MRNRADKQKPNKREKLEQKINDEKNKINKK
jgi:hypothetical protein